MDCLDPSVNVERQKYMGDACITMQQLGLEETVKAQDSGSEL